MIKSNFIFIVSIWFCVGMFFIPLFFLPNAIVAYEVPKVKFFLVWSSVLFISAYFALLLFLQLRIEIPNRFLVALAFLFLMFVLPFFGADYKRSFFGNFYRWDGLVTLMSLLSFGFSVFILKKVIDLEKMVFYAILFSSFCTFLWSVLQFFTTQLQVYAGFGQPVFLVGYLFVISPILLYGSKKYLKSWWVVYAVLLMISITGLMTKTILGFLSIPFYILAVLYISNKIGIRFLLVCVMAISFVAVGIYTIEQRKIDDFVFESRQRIFWKSWLSFKDKPLVGWGHANYDTAFSAIDWPIKVNDDVYMDKAHSHLLEYMVTTGLVGLSSYLLVIFYFFRDLLRSTKKNSKYLLLVLVFYTVHSQTNIVGISEEIIFWLVFGLTDL